MTSQLPVLKNGKWQKSARTNPAAGASGQLILGSGQHGGRKIETAMTSGVRESLRKYLGSGAAAAANVSDPRIPAR